MPYVRRRGSHLAIVHGSRHPETRKVEQQVLMTIHSKAEALAALGRTPDSAAGSFRSWMQNRYPEIRFPWPKIEAAIDELKDELPDIARSREERSTRGFDGALREFARHVIEADPQMLDSAREVIERNRAVLEWLGGVLSWRLEASKRSTRNDWSRDPFGWRLALGGGGTIDPELEEQIAELIHEQPERAEDIFQFLVGLYPAYAEGWNYLGIIALDRGDLEEALTRFERCETIGRRLFPKRIARSDYWTRLETRPYIRALRNQWIVLNRLGRYSRALHAAERLATECDDEITAAVFRSATYLNTSAWKLAYDAAVYAAGLYPDQSLCAALAAHELGREREAAARFVHAAANRPRTVAIVLGQRSPEPRTFLEAEDHNGGVSLRKNLAGFLASRRRSWQHHFGRLWKHDAVASLRSEILATERRMHELPGDRQCEYRRLFDRLKELRQWEHAVGLADDLV